MQRQSRQMIKSEAARRLALGIFGLTVLMPVAWGQEEAKNTLELDPVMVETGTPSPGSPLLQAAQIDVLQGDEKDRRESTSLGEMLDHLPGVDTIGAGNQVGKPVIRGLSGNRISILSDGIAVDHQQYGTRHSPNIDPFLSDRIEVMRGASSILYGSNALGGAIDVKPLALNFSSDGSSQFNAETLTRYSTNNHQKDIGIKGTGQSGPWSFAAGLVHRDAGDRTVPDDPTFFPPPPADPSKRDEPAYTGELDFTDFKQLNGQIGLGYRSDIGDFRVRYKGWRNEHNFLLPPPAGKLPPGQGPEGIGQNLENDELQLSADLPMGDTWTLKPSFVWQNNLRQSNAAGVPRKDLFDGTIDIEFDQYTTRLEAWHGNLGFFDAGRIGVEYRTKDQESRGTTQLTPGGTLDNIGIFAFEERSFGALTLQAGLRHDWNKTTAKGSQTFAPTTFGNRDENHYSVTTGSLGGVLTLTDNLVLASNIARGFRAPTLFELHANGVHGGIAAVQIGNADLDEETALNTDLALRWESERLSASATIYRNRISDFIYLEDTGIAHAQSGLPVLVHRQDDAVLKGIELSAKGMVTDQFELAASYSAVNSENAKTGNDLPLQPADEFRVEGTWYPDDWGPLGNPYARLGLLYNADKDAAPGEPFSQFDNAPFGTASTDSYTLLNLGLGFTVGGTVGPPLKFAFEIRNLTDKSYRDFLDTYKGYTLSTGREFRATLRVPFGT